MGNFRINCARLNLVPYEGAGNLTPVLDLSEVPGIRMVSPEEAKLELETDSVFRQWLQREGQKLKADSVMIYYSRPTDVYDFVTFVGEPNASLKTRFSHMCGNGIRSLGLHIYLTSTNLKKQLWQQSGIKIWASGVKSLIFKKVDELGLVAQIQVDMGPFRAGNEKKAYFINQKAARGPMYAFNLEGMLSERAFGIGFNGIESGEPHLVLLNTLTEYRRLLIKLRLTIGGGACSLIESLPKVVSILGNRLTFDLETFPEGVNTNLGLVVGDTIYLATHEKSLAVSKKACLDSRNSSGICRCVTLACGTGGAAVANIAFLQKYCKRREILTIHQGGEIIYRLSPRTTLMVGPARRII